MKYFSLLSLTLMLAFITQAQDYKIGFTGSGGTVVLDSVQVVNITQNISLTLSQSDTLYLYNLGSEISENQRQKENIRYYPNPIRGGNGTLSFYLDQPAETSIKIYDVTGRLILDRQLYLGDGHNMFSINGMPSGYFIVSITNSYFSGSIKLISIDGTPEGPELTFLDHMLAYTDKLSPQPVKTTRSIIGMEYNHGEPLVFTAYSSGIISVESLIPLQSQIIDFQFDSMPPVANFMVSDTFAQPGYFIHFMDQSTNNPDAWHWDFGNGDTSNEQNPVYVYNSGGIYTVSLTATNYAGSDTKVRTDHITIIVPPTADFTASDTLLFIGDTVLFTDQTFLVPNSWLWSFGDGNTSNVQHPFHSYDTCGDFTVSLAAGNILGSDTIVEVDYITVIPPPEASFSVSTPFIQPGDTVSFTDHSDNMPDTWHWDFGDGHTSNVQHPDHIYDSSGVYSVSLVATNNSGSDTAIKADYINVADTTFGEYPMGTVHCVPFPEIIAVVVDVTNPVTGKIWMDRNIGALQPAISMTDSLAYGDLYQWGRFSDGHQCRDSDTTSVTASTYIPGHGDFIINDINWKTGQFTDLWAGVNGVTNPCPNGYRLPTDAELQNELQSWATPDLAGAYASPLQWLPAGRRFRLTGLMGDIGVRGFYWSSTPYGNYQASSLTIQNNSAYMFNLLRPNGVSVRCIKD